MWRRLLGLHVPVSRRGHVQGEHRILGGDVAAEVRELKARGVVFQKYDMPGIEMENSIASASGAKTAWLKDSEGNILVISQRVSS